MFYKKLCTFIISIVCLILVVNVNIYANDENISCCNTSPELLEELHNELLQKKNKEVKNNDESISLFSQFIGVSKQHLMPSTGTVRALVVPITFPEHPISDEVYNGIKDGLFGKHQSPNYFDFSSENQISVKEYFDFHSNGKMNFTGDILPVYMCKEMPVYYDNNDTNFNNLLSEILSFYKTEGVVDNYSKYDSDSDGYIDCLILMYASFDDLTYMGEPKGHHAWGYFVTSGGNIVIENDDTRVNCRANIPYHADSSEMNDILLVNSILHECCHLMGLDDNYNPYDDSNNCTLYGLNEVMSSTNGRYFFNAYYRYLLDWIDPYILPYEDTIEEINLNAYGYGSNDNTNDAIILVPD